MEIRRQPHGDLGNRAHTEGTSDAESLWQEQLGGAKALKEEMRGGKRNGSHFQQTWDNGEEITGVKGLQRHCAGDNNRE